MNAETWFPPFADWRYAFGLLALSGAIFHALLIGAFKLGKRGWKIVDYFWLGAASLALYGGAGQARQIVAQARTAAHTAETRIAYEEFRKFVSLYGRGGIVCRDFVMSEWSPDKEEFERLQREYNLACDWLKQVEDSLPSDPPDGEMSDRTLPIRPPVSGDLAHIFREFDKQVGWYNKSHRKQRTVEDAARRSATEMTLTLLFPWITALALGLRFTKVTGEVLLERSADRAPFPAPSGSDSSSS